MQITELWVNRTQLRETKIVRHEAAPLRDGEVRLAIDKFALTANNISYAVTGESIGYWGYFPTEVAAAAPDHSTWGKVPAWGFADVVESRCAELPVGERLWGFLPMASHLTVTPGKVTAANFFDFAAHREKLPRLYNQYHRTANDPAMMQTMEDERCLLFPLFATSYIVYDYLLDNALFGAEQVVIASVSSKTAFGLAHLIHHDKKLSQRVVGLTSPQNVPFVEKLGCCDQVLSYDAIQSIDAGKRTAFVDMSGNSAVVRAVHEHIGENLIESCLVGATHWEVDRNNGPLPGARPTFFFAPSRFAKRDRDWGVGVVLMKAFGASAQIAISVKGQVDIVHLAGAEAVREKYLALLDNAVSPSTGLMLSMK